MNEDGELFGHTLKPGEVVPALNPTSPVKKPILIMSLVEPSMKRIPQYLQVWQANHDALLKFLNTQTYRSYLVVIDNPNMGHMSFTDIPLLYEDAKRPGSLQLSEFTRKLATAFFDQFLMKVNSSSALDKALSRNNIARVTRFPQ